MCRNTGLRSKRTVFYDKLWLSNSLIQNLWRWSPVYVGPKSNPKRTKGVRVIFIWFNHLKYVLFFDTYVPSDKILSCIAQMCCTRTCCDLFVSSRHIENLNWDGKKGSYTWLKMSFRTHYNWFICFCTVKGLNKIDKIHHMYSYIFQYFLLSRNCHVQKWSMRVIHVAYGGFLRLAVRYLESVR